MPPKSFPAVRRSDRKPHKTRLFSALAGVVGPEIILILAYVVKQTSLAVDDNAANYGIARMESLPNSPLQVKTIIILGSSVTAGSAAPATLRFK